MGKKKMQKLYHDAIEEAKKDSFDEFLPFGFNYFNCGYSENGIVYNQNIAIAFAIIGKTVGDKSQKNSDYHKGIAWIALKAGVSKRQVKVLRKMFSYHSGYVYKTPYKIPEILDVMINYFRNNNTNHNIQYFLEQYKGQLYRDILISDQYSGIIIAAGEGKRKKVIDVADKLGSLTYTIKEK